MNSELHQRLRDAEAQVDRLSHALNVEREHATRFSSALLAEQRINENHEGTIRELRETNRKQVEHMLLPLEFTVAVLCAGLVATLFLFSVFS